jgi:hypothetical protein
METFQGIIRLMTFECARLNDGTLMQKITLERHASTGKNRREDNLWPEGL